MPRIKLSSITTQPCVPYKPDFDMGIQRNPETGALHRRLPDGDLKDVFERMLLIHRETVAAANRLYRLAILPRPLRVGRIDGEGVAKPESDLFDEEKRAKRYFLVEKDFEKEPYSHRDGLAVSVVAGTTNAEGATLKLPNIEGTMTEEEREAPLSADGSSGGLPAGFMVPHRPYLFVWRPTTRKWLVAGMGAVRWQDDIMPQIPDGSLPGSLLADGSVDGARLAPGSVGARELGFGADAGGRRTFFAFEADGSPERLSKGQVVELLKDEIMVRVLGAAGVVTRMAVDGETRIPAGVTGHSRVAGTRTGTRTVGDKENRRQETYRYTVYAPRSYKEWNIPSVALQHDANLAQTTGLEASLVCKEADGSHSVGDTIFYGGVAFRNATANSLESEPITWTSRNLGSYGSSHYPTYPTTYSVPSGGGSGETVAITPEKWAVKFRVLGRLG